MRLLDLLLNMDYKNNVKIFKIKEFLPSSDFIYEGYVLDIWSDGNGVITDELKIYAYHEVLNIRQTNNSIDIYIIEE